MFPDFGDAAVTPRKAEDCARAMEIARVAVRLFAERGYDATPVRAIADAVGVTCPTLYYYFGSKEGLAQALLIRPIGSLIETMKQLAESDSHPIERLTAAVDVYFDFHRADRDRSRFLWAICFAPAGEGLSAEIDGLFRGLTDRFRDVLLTLARDGWVDGERLDDLSRSLRGQIIIHIKEYLYRDVQLDAGLAKRLVSSTLCGYLTGDARERFDSAWRPALDRVEGKTPETPSDSTVSATT